MDDHPHIEVWADDEHPFWISVEANDIVLALDDPAFDAAARTIADLALAGF